MHIYVDGIEEKGFGWRQETCASTDARCEDTAWVTSPGLPYGVDACGCTGGYGWRTLLCTANDRCEGNDNGQCNVGSRTSPEEAALCLRWAKQGADGMPALGNAAYPDPRRPSPGLGGFTLAPVASLGADERARLDFDGYIAQLGARRTARACRPRSPARARLYGIVL